MEPEIEVEEITEETTEVALGEPIYVEMTAGLYGKSTLSS